MANDIFNQVTDRKTLREGWKRVRANKGAPGGDNISIGQFGAKLEYNLERLEKLVRSGEYRPGRLARFKMKKPSGGVRVLAIPCVADRVVQASAALVLDEIIDPTMSDASFAYRRGRSVEHAVGRIMTYRLWGHEWVVDGDIKSYFDSIPHEALLNDLCRHVSCRRTKWLVRLWLRNFSDYGIGISQGSPLSPLLANLYLTPVDKGIETRRIRLVRYADDFLLLSRRKKTALWALERITELLEKRSLRLNEQKTSITCFSDGFKFLGYMFSRKCLTPRPVG